MLEPLPVSFGPQRSLQPGRDVPSPVPGQPGSSPRAAFGDMEASAGFRQGPTHSPRFDQRPTSSHGNMPPEVGFSILSAPAQCPNATFAHGHCSLRACNLQLLCSANLA